MENQIFEAVDLEIVRARELYPRNFSSYHEGYAVLKEEMDELWELIKHKKLSDIKNEPVDHRIKEECIHVAAMAMRFLYDCCEWDNAPAKGGDGEVVRGIGSANISKGEM